MADRVLTQPKALLMGMQNVVGLGVSGRDGGEVAGPEFIECAMEANWALVGEEVRVTAFMQEDCMGLFPRGGSDVREPHEDKQEMQRLVESVGHDAKELIRDTVRTRGFPLG